MRVHWRYAVAGLLKRLGARGIRKNPPLAVCHAGVIVASAFLIALVCFPSASDIGWGGGVRVHHPATGARNEALERGNLIGEIHDSHSVPWRLLRPVPTAELRLLLSYLREPSRAFIPGATRRIVFAHITGSDEWDRVRAIAKVLAYARGTDRIAVIYWYQHADYTQRFEDVYVLRQGGGCVPVVVANLLDDELALREKARTAGAHVPFSVRNVDTTAGEEPSTERERAHAAQGDWAEFSVEELADAEAADDTLSTRQAGPRLRTGRTLEDALDEVAVKNMHVSFALSGGGPLRTQYTRLHDAEEVLHGCVSSHTTMGRLAVSTAHLQVKALGELDATAVTRTLHDDYHLPWVLLSGLRPVMARLLLDKLAALRREGELAPRTIWVQPQYGLGNRLRVLGSVLALARATNRVLVLIWARDKHLDCEYSDLFLGHEDVLVSESFAPYEKWPFARLRAHDTAMHAVAWYNYMRVHGEHLTPPSQPVDDAAARHIYVSSAYVVMSNSTPGIIRTQSAYWQVLRELAPTVSVARLVARSAHRVQRKQGLVMGVHVRTRSLSRDIPGVAPTYYTETAARTTDYWRALTNVHAFLVEMRRQKHSTTFYVAADDRAVLRLFDQVFPGRVTYTPRDCDSRDRRCLPYAMADILLLAKCPSIRGSYWSSFTELSCRWGGARFQLAGVDFGKPPHRAQKNITHANTNATRT